jgi:hypothetical protein
LAKVSIVGAIFSEAPTLSEYGEQDEGKKGSTTPIMSLTRINPPIPLLTPKGPGLAHFIDDQGIENHYFWVVFLDHSGECWTFKNPEIRIATNITYGRNKLSKILNNGV